MKINFNKNILKYQSNCHYLELKQSKILLFQFFLLIMSNIIKLGYQQQQQKL